MSYATPAELIERLGADEAAKLADRRTPFTVRGAGLARAARGESIADLSANEQAATAEAVANITQALRDASDTIDGYIAARAQLPLASTPRVLTRLAVELGRVYLRRGEATEEMRRREDAALKALRDIADGKLSLGLNAAGVETPAASQTCEMHSHPTVFGRSESGGFI